MLNLPTLADVEANPAILDALKSKDEIALACSFCGDPLTKRKGHILRAIKAGQPGSYCGRRCRGQHVLELATVVRDGIEGRICSVCGEWVPKNKMTAKGRAKVCRRCRRNQPRNKFSILRSQAGHRGHAWTLTYEELMTLWGEPCSYCGEAIETVGLDRVDSSKGYELTNVVPCCHPCNRGKGNGTVEDFVARCRGVSGRHGSSR